MAVDASVPKPKVEKLVRLYPKVNERETPLPRSWSAKDKYTYIGLSQNNLRVHYKGRLLVCAMPVDEKDRVLQVAARTTRMLPLFGRPTPYQLPAVCTTSRLKLSAKGGTGESVHRSCCCSRVYTCMFGGRHT